MCLAVPGLIKSIENSDPLNRMGKVSFDGLLREVNLSLVPEAVVGDYVIVHVGMALHQVDAEEAQKIIEDIRAVQGPDRSEG